jgi:hypothetical protein
MYEEFLSFQSLVYRTTKACISRLLHWSSRGVKTCGRDLESEEPTTYIPARAFHQTVA